MQRPSDRAIRRPVTVRFFGSIHAGGQTVHLLCMSKARNTVIRTSFWIHPKAKPREVREAAEQMWQRFKLTWRRY